MDQWTFTFKDKEGLLGKFTGTEYEWQMFSLGENFELISCQKN